MQFRYISKEGLKFSDLLQTWPAFLGEALSHLLLLGLSLMHPISNCQTTKNSVFSNPKSTNIPGRESTGTIQKQLRAQDNNYYSSCVSKAFPLWV